MKFIALLLMLAGASAAQNDSLEIIGAYYGLDDRFADVTARVRAMVQTNGGAVIPVAPSSFGGLDPARGVVKVLRIYYRWNGQFNNGEWRDGDTAQIGAPPVQTTVRRRGLRIVRAVYGAGNRTVDVTRLLQSRVSNNAIEVQVTNANMGGVDPAPAVVKELQLAYEIEGRARELRIRESDWLRLPEGASPAVPTAGLRILSATYGTASRNSDVTKIVTSLITDDRLTLTVGANTLSVDPARGDEKVLYVVYLWKGQQYEARVSDGRVMDIPPRNPGRPSPSLYSNATDGACFFAEPNFRGASYCVAAGQNAQQMPPFARYGSVQFKGRVRSVDLYEQPGFKGNTVRLRDSQADLGALGSWTGQPGSVRLN